MLMKFCARLLLVIMVFASVILSACGPSSALPDESTADRLAASPLPTLNFKQPTSMIEQSSPEAQGEATAAPPQANLSQGERVYNNKKCGDCHGAQGEGVADKANGLAGTLLTEAEFTDILRTGAKGKLGNDHLYGTQAISPSGLAALYAYIKSLPKP
jgi:mono/diheme cytochrome c family protein